MVGGGSGSQIGYAHRDAAQRDKLFKLVCGAFDINHQRGIRFGMDIGLDKQRCYKDYQTLIAAEKKRKDGIEVLTIATPNNTHYEITKAALCANLHVICEKPLTFNTQQAQELKALAEAKNLLLAVMYGYSGYVMIEQARQMIAQDMLGQVRIVNMEFAHGYHAEAVEKHNTGMRWRITPEVAGPSYVLGDIGTHCFQMGQLLSGLTVEQLMCIRQSFVKNRAPLEDNAYVLLTYQNGAVGSLWASAVNIGAAHSFKVRIIGEKGSLQWWDEHPNQLKVAMLNQPEQTLEHGFPYMLPSAQFDRIGGGHPEGFFESWANLYRRFGIHIAGIKDDLEQQWFPTAQEGLEGVRFVEKCVESANHGGRWVKFN